MNTIHKYELKGDYDKPAKATIPAGAKILDINFQRGDLFIWALVDTEIKDEQEVQYEVYGTGWRIDNPEGLVHVKTIYLGDALVWHVFVRK